MSGDGKIRDLINENNMRKIMSTRTMRDATDMMQQCDWSIKDVEEGYFRGLDTRGNEGRKNERGGIVSKHLYCDAQDGELSF